MKPLKHLIPLAALAFAHILPAAETNGFAVTFTSADARTSDRLVLPNLWLFVESGRPAAPFLPPGRFTAVFEGSISGDLRADYLFRAEELGGALKLEVNGATVLETTAAGAMSGPVRIRKGTNTVRATFTSPPGGDAFLRVGWAEKGTNSGPIPSAWITHAPTPDLDQAQLLRRGRELFLEQRCAKCHTEKFATPAPELTADSPALDGIGTRRNFAWLAKWIADPKATRARVSMPKLLHGATTKEDAEAVAAYLASLTSSPGPDAGAPPGRAADRTGADSAGAKAITEISKRSGPDAKPTLAGVPDQPVENAERKPLFERLHCAGCHNGPEEGANDPAKISLKHVAAKFGRGPLVEFLLAPERHWAWNPMPNFKLAEIEAKELADHLLKHAEPAETRTAPTGKAVLERGRALVQGSGCLNCHAIAGLENKYSAPPLARLSKEAGGCLAERRDEKSKSPGFTFNASDRRALLAFMKTDLASLSRHAPLEFATRAVREMQCAACHGQIDFVPPVEVLGGKLRPEWAAEFIGGRPFKVRADIHPKGDPWVAARMPGYRARAGLIAAAMTMQQGYPPKTPAEPPVDPEAAKTGHRMTGKDNGLSCISCHAVNDMPALEVFESEGTNLGLTAARLRKEYFFRWLRAPLAIDPQSKMPAYFEDGRSALTDYYDGDGEKQINALYEYFRLGDAMPAPATGQ